MTAHNPIVDDGSQSLIFLTEGPSASTPPCSSQDELTTLMSVYGCLDCLALEKKAFSLIHQNNFEEAEVIYLALIHAGETSPSIFCSLASIYLRQNRPADSKRLLEKALEANPSYAEALNNLGICQQAEGDFVAAIDSYMNALRCRPIYPEARNNLGIVLHGTGELKAAIGSYAEALRIKPDYPDALNNLGLALHDQGNLAASIAAYTKALRIQPDFAAAHWNLSLVRLLCGDYQTGLEHYEWRHFDLGQAQTALHALPQCKRVEAASALGGVSRLLLVSEQGLGDTLHFIRYVFALRSQGITVSVCAQERLHGLIKSSGIDSSPLTPEQANQVVEGHWMPLLSLPRQLQVSPSNPIVSSPYLKAPDDLTDKWAHILGRENRPIIGINWQGDPDHESTIMTSGRSLALQCFGPIAADSGVTLLALQKGFGSEQLEVCSFRDRFVSCQEQISAEWDFEETAAIISQCDLIISSDTAVAHLAAAMGMPTWLLLKKVPAWRWGMEGHSTFWYPSMRLFRQKDRGNWHEVIERVAHELRMTFAHPPIH